MGSEKFPSENGFDKFVNTNGGFDNAHTECEHTTFYFEIQRRHLPKRYSWLWSLFLNNETHTIPWEQAWMARNIIVITGS